MKLETVMSIGYVKGRYWVSDDMFAKYAQRLSYKAFMSACREAGFAVQCEYSYTAQQYTAEIITFTKMTNSSNYYYFKHNNAYDANPLAAMGRAAVESDYATPLIRALVLEMECELLRDAYKAAETRQKHQALIEHKLDRAFTELTRAIKAFSLPTWDEVFSDMIRTEYGTYVDPAARNLAATFDEDDDL